ncbi:hypothetical protein [Micromonospora tulbaghiae]|uniref:hypothetical protein n=1 Tax=Micromonospora tulbaghiae TaxID=479978 RepID=UPI003EBD4308
MRQVHSGQGLTRRLPGRCHPRIGLRLDTSDQTPEETVTEILARAWTGGQIG